jgi:short-subunit dehydrogenase
VLVNTFVSSAKTNMRKLCVDFPIRDRVVVLTGAGSGIGRALSHVLATRGALLALIDLDEAGLTETADALKREGSRIQTYVADVSDKSAVTSLPDQIAADLGSASVLINNAGVGLSGNFEQVTEEQFDRVMRINFSATVAVTRNFLPQLRTNAPSQIVNLSSIFGIVGFPGNVAYCSSKFAVRGFSEALRIELMDSNVGVTVVHPGGVQTNIARNAEVGPGVSSQSLAQMRVTAGKFLRMSPDDVAGRIVRAITRREKRVVIGADAHLITALQRLFPVSYGRFFPHR